MSSCSNPMHEVTTAGYLTHVVFDGLAAAPKVVIDNYHAVVRPAEIRRSFDQRVLPGR
jgi:hypothetical protein